MSRPIKTKWCKKVQLVEARSKDLGAEGGSRRIPELRLARENSH